MSYVIINFVVVMTSPVNKGQAARSLLSKLRASTQLELMRKRKLRVKALSHTGTRKERPTCLIDLIKGVGVMQRAKEFAGV